MEVIRSNIDAVIKVISSRKALDDLRPLQLDQIPKYPPTSTLLRCILGPSENVSLSAPLGLDQLHLIKALIGRAVHDWVFGSHFPASLYKRDKTLEIIKGVLDKKRLDIPGKSIISDIAYDIAQTERSTIKENAFQLAIDLGNVLAPMLERHESNEALYGGANVGESPQFWIQYRSSMQTLFEKCFELKFDLELGAPFESRWFGSGEAFESRWFGPGKAYEKGFMQVCKWQDSVHNTVRITLLGAIIVKNKCVYPAVVLTGNGIGTSATEHGRTLRKR